MPLGLSLLRAIQGQGGRSGKERKARVKAFFIPQMTQLGGVWQLNTSPVTSCFPSYHGVELCLRDLGIHPMPFTFWYSHQQSSAQNKETPHGPSLTPPPITKMQKDTIAQQTLMMKGTKRIKGKCIFHHSILSWHHSHCICTCIIFECLLLPTDGHACLLGHQGTGVLPGHGGHEPFCHQDYQSAATTAGHQQNS